MSILEKIKLKKDTYIYLRAKAEEKMSILIKNRDKSSNDSWHFWNGVKTQSTLMISDLTEIERLCEQTFNSIEIDLSALRGE